MSSALKRLVLQTRRQQLQLRPSTTAVFMPSLHEPESGSAASTSLQAVQESSAAYYPFPTIHHFNLALAEAVRDQRWSDVGFLEEGLAPFCEAHDKVDQREAVHTLLPPELEYDGSAESSLTFQHHQSQVEQKHARIRPSAETFQLLMAGRLQLGDWCGALSYFSDSQNELLPVADATIRMTLRALRCASPHAVWSTAIALFRSYQHRVTTADTTDILFDVLIDAGKYDMVQKLYEETKETLPLDGSIVAIAESARHTGNWQLAARLASAAVTSPLPVQTSIALVGCGLAALLEAGRYRDVLVTSQQGTLSPLMDEDALLVSARAAVALRHAPTVLDVVEKLEHRQASLDAQRDACNLTLLTLHHCAIKLASSEVQPASAVRAVLKVALTQQRRTNAQRGKWSSGGSWVGGLLTIASLRNVDAISVVDAVVLMEPLRKWDAALAILAHAHGEFLTWKELDCAARSKHKPHVQPPWVSSPITVWAVERALAAFPREANHQIRRVAFLRSAVELGWVSAPLAAILLEAAGSSSQSGFLDCLDGRWLFHVLQDSAHSMSKCLRDLERLVDVAATGCDADAALESLMQVVMSDDDSQLATGWHVSLGKELVRHMVQRHTQGLPPVSTRVLQLLERNFCLWLLKNNMREHALTLLRTTSVRWLLSGSENEGEHLDRVGDAIVSNLLQPYVHLGTATDGTVLSVASRLLRAHLNAGRSAPFAQMLAVLLPSYSSDPSVAAEVHALIAIFLEQQQRTGGDVSALANVTGHLMTVALTENSVSTVSSLLERIVVHDVAINPNRLADYFASRTGVLWMRRQWKTSTVPRLGFLRTAVQRIPDDQVPEGAAYEYLRMHTIVATNNPVDLEAVTYLLGRWFVAWSQTPAPRCSLIEKVLELLTLGRNIPVPSLLVRAYANDVRRHPSSPSAEVLETAHRVLLTWHLEGRAIPMVQQPGVLALPSSLNAFSSSIKALSVERSDCLSSSHFVCASMDVMDHSPNRRINAVRLCHALLSIGSQVVRDDSVAAKAIQVASSIPPNLEHDVQEVCESRLWKLLVAFPHVVKGIPLASTVGRALIAAALRHRPLVLWDTVVDWLQGALRNVSTITAHERRDSLAIVGTLASKRGASSIEVQQLRHRLDALPNVHSGEEAWVSVLHGLQGRPPTCNMLDSVLPWEVAAGMSPELKQVLQQAATEVLRAGTSTLEAVKLALMVLMHTHAPVPDVPETQHSVIWQVVASWLEGDAAAFSIGSVVAFLPTTTLMGAIAAKAESCFRIRSLVHQRKEAELANVVMDNVVGSDFGTWVVASSPQVRSHIVSACIYLGRWRELASLANRWLAADATSESHVDMQRRHNHSGAALFATPVGGYLLRIIAASWKTQGHLLTHAPTQCIAEHVGERWQRMEDTKHALNVSEMIACCQRALVQSRNNSNETPQPFKVVQRAALEYVARAPWLTSVSTQASECWRDALARTLDGKMALTASNVGEILRVVRDGSNGAITALYILDNLRVPHVPNRVPLRLCEEAIAACPAWQDAISLTIRSAASLGGRPTATQRYLVFLTLERMRKGSWSADGKPMLMWNVACALLQVATGGNYQRLPQRAFVEVLRHSYANPDCTLELYRCFQSNNYPRLEGVNHLLSLIRSARWNRRCDLLELATQEFVAMSGKLSSNNRCKMLKELSLAANALMPAEDRTRFCESMRSILQLSEAEELLLL